MIRQTRYGYWVCRGEWWKGSHAEEMVVLQESHRSLLDGVMKLAV